MHLIKGSLLTYLYSTALLSFSTRYIQQLKYLTALKIRDQKTRDQNVHKQSSEALLEFNDPFQHKYGYIKDDRLGVESNPYLVKLCQQHINLNPGRV